jgi:hypothetical protein
LVFDPDPSIVALSAGPFPPAFFLFLLLRDDVLVGHFSRLGFARLKMHRIRGSTPRLEKERLGNILTYGREYGILNRRSEEIL